MCFGDEAAIRYPSSKFFCFGVFNFSSTSAAPACFSKPAALETLLGNALILSFQSKGQAICTQRYFSCLCLFDFFKQTYHNESK